MKAPIFGRPGLSEKEFNRVLDEYLTTGSLSVNDYNLMDRDQENIIQAIKRSLRRIRHKLRT
jgi:hypothetical protein